VDVVDFASTGKEFRTIIERTKVIVEYASTLSDTG
jgi:hypothetical protein